MTVAVTLVLRNGKADAETLPWERWLEAWGADLVMIQTRKIEEAHSYKITVEPREVTDGQLTLGEEGSPTTQPECTSGPSTPSNNWIYQEWLYEQNLNRQRRLEAAKNAGRNIPW